MTTTPMMSQYKKIKSENKDSILLFRLGDFYEAFNDDAKEISKILNITLTGRGKGETRVPMAGIPHHALPSYLRRLIKAGKKIAIAEQMEEAQTGKIVERKVIKIVTAGTVTDLYSLDDATNNYLLAIHFDKKSSLWDIAYADLTTGEFRTVVFEGKSQSEFPKDVASFIFKTQPNEILIPRDLVALGNNFSKTSFVQVVDQVDWSIEKSTRILKDHFETDTLKGFGYQNNAPDLVSAGIILYYLKDSQKTNLEHIKSIKKLDNNIYMDLDPSTIRNLELIWPISSDNKAATLFGVLNKCDTPMGQRLLKRWILSPLKSIEKIERRFDAISELIKDPIKLSAIKEKLAEFCDIERVVSKIGTGSLNARDLLFLASTLEKVIKIAGLTEQLTNPLLNINQNFKGAELSILEEIIKLINTAIEEDPPTTITEGGIIKKGYNAELDEIKELQEKGSNWLRDLQAKEQERTGISSLKIKFNNVFGYYIEVSKSNLDKVPSNYIRKQTLVNAERFFTEELKEWENKILGANDKAAQLEYAIFNEIKNKLIEQIPLLLEIGNKISVLDVICSFTFIARNH